MPGDDVCGPGERGCPAGRPLDDVGCWNRRGGLSVEEVSRDVELHRADLALGRVEGHAGEFRHARRVGHVDLQSGHVLLDEICYCKLQMIYLKLSTV